MGTSDTYREIKNTLEVKRIVCIYMELELSLNQNSLEGNVASLKNHTVGAPEDSGFSLYLPLTHCTRVGKSQFRESIFS